MKKQHYILAIAGDDGTACRRLSPRKVPRGEWVMYHVGVNPDSRLGVVESSRPARRHKTNRAMDEAAIYPRIDAILEPVEPTTKIVLDYGIVCVYNYYLPNGIQACYWTNDSEAIYFAATQLIAEDKLREKFTQDFFERADREL